MDIESNEFYSGKYNYSFFKNTNALFMLFISVIGYCVYGQTLYT